MSALHTIATGVSKGLHRCHRTRGSDRCRELIAHQDEVHVTMSHDQLIEIVQASCDGVGVAYM
jgi:hypothetical protein